EYEQRYGKKEEEADMVEEVQLVIPPPVEATQLLGFASRVEEIFNSSLLQIIGSWQNGTALTICLTKATPLADVIKKLEEMPEIEEVVEKPPSKTPLRFLNNVTPVPRLARRRRITLFVKLKPL
ncbi:unnamed protein product, partial [marine sediment metagenome]